MSVSCPTSLSQSDLLISSKIKHSDIFSEKDDTILKLKTLNCFSFINFYHLSGYIVETSDLLNENYSIFQDNFIAFQAVELYKLHFFSQKVLQFEF